MRLMHKDIRLALQAARRSHLPLPAAVAADHVLSLAEEAGYGDRDIAGMFEVLAAAPDNADISPFADRPAAA
jgi:3-hydroxyisobutyrate dehydrogenase-like beta-hydroxyacid dehydrogenase